MRNIVKYTLQLSPIRKIRFGTCNSYLKPKGEVGTLRLPCRHRRGVEV